MKTMDAVERPATDTDGPFVAAGPEPAGELWVPGAAAAPPPFVGPRAGECDPATLALRPGEAGVSGSNRKVKAAAFPVNTVSGRAPRL